MSKRDVMEYLKKRDAAIAQAQKRLLTNLSANERLLLDKLIDLFVERFTLEKGVITFDGKNLSLTTAVDKLVEEFRKNVEVKLLDKYLSDINSITSLQEDYFSKMGFGKKMLDGARRQATGFIKARLGINTGGELVKRGFLDSFISDRSLAQEVKNLLLNSVSTGERFTVFQSRLKNIIQGGAQVDGGLTRYWKAYVFDTYQQMDNIIAERFATTLQLQCGLYAGGLIDTSREFCIDKDGKVFTRQEMLKWKDDPLLPRTKEERELGSVKDYNPFSDRGRWRCRHNINWITNELAIQLRPDLKGKLITMDTNQKAAA